MSSPVPEPGGLGPLSHLLGGVRDSMEDGLAMGVQRLRGNAPGFAPSWLGAPPMVAQLGEGLLNSSWFREFFDGMKDEMRRQLEQSALLTDLTKANWDAVAQTQKELLGEATKAVEEIAGLKDAPMQRLAAQRAMNEMNLPEVIKERALSFFEALGAFGQDIQRQAIAVEAARDSGLDAGTSAADEQVTEMLGRVFRVLGINERTIELARNEEQRERSVQVARQEREEGREEAQERPRAAGTPTSAGGRPRGPGRGPYDDVVDTGEVGPADRPDPGGRPEGQPEAERAEAERAREGTPRPDPGGFLSALPDTWQGGMEWGADSANWRTSATGAISDRIDTWASEWGNINRPARVLRPDGTMGWADEAAGAAYEASMSRIGRVQGAINAYGAGEGLSGAIAKGAPTVGKALGVAGVVVGGAQMATGVLESQRAANMPYTSTYGRGQLDAYGQRAEEWAYANLAMAGTMGSDQARALYQGVAEQGLEGQSREDALEFAVANYRRFGMSIQQSMQFIEIATETGIESLDAYRQGLTAVAETAQQAGESIKEAQQSYLETVQATRGFTSGSAGAQLATAIEGVSQARAHTPLGDVEWAGALQNDTLMNIVSARTGTSYADVRTGIQSGTEMVGIAIAEAEEAFIEYAVGNRQPSAQTRARIAQIKQAAGGGTPTNDQVMEIISMLVQDGVYEPRTLPSIARSLGLPMNEVQMEQLIARHFLDDPLLDAEGLDAAARERYDQAELDVTGLRPGFTMGLDMLGAMNAKDSLMQEFGLATPDSERGWAATRFGNNVIDDADPLYKSTDEYFGQIRRGERTTRSANLEAIYRSIGTQAKTDMEGARAWQDATFVTTDASGGEVRFGIEDLAKYSSQVEAGQVQQVRADGSRVALQDVFGFTPESSQTTPPQQVVKVEIEAKGPLADVLTVNQVGGTDIERNRARGTPPGAFQFSPGLSDFLGGG